MKHALLATIFLYLFLISGFSATPLQAGGLIKLNGTYYESSGEYYVEEDEDGVYLKTDQAASWHLSGDELSAFKPGVMSPT